MINRSLIYLLFLNTIKHNILGSLYKERVFFTFDQPLDFLPVEIKEDSNYEMDWEMR